MTTKQFDVPDGPFGTPCVLASRVAASDQWEQLRAIASASGWPE